MRTCAGHTSGAGHHDGFVDRVRRAEGSCVDFVGSDLKLPAALLVILGVLLLRPAGLFGKPVVKKV